MTFDSIEQSIQSASPCELYDFIAPAWSFHLTSYHKDVVWNSQTYKATPQSRSSLSVTDIAGDADSVTIEIPASHQLAQEYVPGIPVRELLVTITRLHVASGVALQLWQGYAASLSFREHVASFAVPSALGQAMQLDVPNAVAQRLCNHILYDEQCTAARLSAATTITSISSDGKTISIAGIGGNPDHWAQHGELLHAASTERRTITEQVGTALTIQCAFPTGSIAVGDAVTAYAGCDHTVTTCKAKFNNVPNFGGFPSLPPSNLFYVGIVNARYH